MTGASVELLSYFSVGRKVYTVICFVSTNSVTCFRFLFWQKALPRIRLRVKIFKDFDVGIRLKWNCVTKSHFSNISFEFGEPDFTLLDLELCCSASVGYYRQILSYSTLNWNLGLLVAVNR